MSESYIFIGSPFDFEKIRNINHGGRVVIDIMNDINMDSIPVFKPIDLPNSDIIIRGHDHVISNLSILDYNKNITGLFRRCKSIEVSLLTIKDAGIVGEEIVGTLAGEVSEDAKIYGLHVDASVTGSSIVGGLCGKARNVYAFNSTFTGEENARGAIGGVCGMAETYHGSNVKMQMIQNNFYKIKNPLVYEDVGYLSSREKSKVMQITIAGLESIKEHENTDGTEMIRKLK